MHDNFTILIFIMIVVIVCAVYYYGNGGFVKDKLEQYKEKQIHEFTDGETGKIIGTVVIPKGPLLRAPLTGRNCAYYYVRVDERERFTGDDGNTWSTIIEKEVGDNILITDGMNYAAIKTKTINSHIIRDAEFSSGFMDDATVELENFLKKNGRTSVNAMGFNKSMRYYEGVLEEGEKISVLGKMKWVKVSETSFRLPVEKILIVGPDNKEPVYITDDVS